MIRTTLLATLVPAAALAATPRHFEVSADFAPRNPSSAQAAVAVTFQPVEPELRLNESPAPRLKLDLAQTVLVDRQAPPSHEVPDYDPLTARYLDPAKPVHFPVSIAPGAPKGTHEVKATVVFFYCSTRESWCRRGTADISIPVTVR
jgi:hypothetical protein